MKDLGVDLVRLSCKGKAIIGTDLHGNLDDFNKLIKAWEDISPKKNHLVLTGDFIHAMGRDDDRSLDILDKIMDCRKYKNFHLLLGNHEWATIIHISVYKGGLNQSLNFNELLKNKFGDEWNDKLEEYTTFFQQLPVAVRTDNGVFISHAGPPEGVKSLDEIMDLTSQGYFDNDKLYGLLWNRYHDYCKDDVDNFLKVVDCQAMIVGHTPVNGYKLIGNQLIVSSSYTMGKKAYVELDLEREIHGGLDLEKMIKYLQ